MSTPAGQGNARAAATATVVTVVRAAVTTAAAVAAIVCAASAASAQTMPSPMPSPQPQPRAQPQAQPQPQPQALAQGEQPQQAAAPPQGYAPPPQGYPPPPQGYAPPPQGYPPPPQGYAPPPQAYYPQPGYYQPAPMLTLEERSLLADGEISSGQIVFGVALNGWIGLGLGQAVQGRWSDTGWIFTVGEPLTLTIGLASLLRCESKGCNDNQETLVLGAFLGYLGLRAWSVIDAITGPMAHNRKVRDLRMRVGMPTYSLSPYLAPTPHGGATAGLSLRF